MDTIEDVVVKTKPVICMACHEFVEMTFEVYPEMQSKLTRMDMAGDWNMWVCPKCRRKYPANLWKPEQVG